MMSHTLAEPKELDDALDNLADLSHSDLVDKIEIKDNLIWNLEKQLTTTQQSLDSAREALRFYANCGNMKEIMDDYGTIAMNALQKVQ